MGSTDDLRGAWALVTGGAGFVGTYVIRRLIEAGVERVVAVDNLLRGSRENMAQALATGRAELVVGDIRDRGLMLQLTEGMDLCFHLAALRITRCAEDPREAFDVMYSGTFNVIEACVKNRLRKLVAASTASVYGQAETFPTNERHHPYNNRTLYGAAKLSNELMYRAFHDMHGLNYAALRYFNIYGPLMDREGKYTEVLIRWYYLIKTGRPPVIFGDGNQTMDFIYVDDVARATVLAASPLNGCDVFNIAGGREVSLRELVDILLKVMGSTLRPQFVPLPPERKQVEVMRRLADVSLAEKVMGFKAEVSLEEGLGRLVNWLDGLSVVGGVVR